MKIHKYPIARHGKQRVAGFSMASLAAPTPLTPLVATVENAHVTLFWWNPSGAPDGEARWHSFERLCTELVSGTGGASEGQLKRDQRIIHSNTLRLHRRHTQRLGLAANSDTAFLLYRKQPTDDSGTPLNDENRLQLERITWDPDTETLVSQLREGGGPGPIVIPEIRLENYRTGSLVRHGFALWAGYVPATGDLVVLSQGWMRGSGLQLYLLRANVSDPSVDLEDAGNWHAHYLGDEGDDVDAVIRDDGKICCVFRDKPYALSSSSVTLELANDSTVDIDIGGAAGAPIESTPLTMLLIDPSMDTDPVQYPDLPGGYHPRIHRSVGDSIFVTAERLLSGRVHVDDGDTGLHRFAWEKRLFTYRSASPGVTGGAWFDAQLFLYEDGFVPHGLLHPDLVSYNRFGGDREWGPDSAVRLTPVVNGDPEILTRYEMGSVKEGELLDFAHRYRPFEAVLISRFSIRINNDRLEIEPIGYTVLDINHAQIVDPTDESNPQTVETRRFAPFILTDDDYPDTPVDNTLGGWLECDRTRADLTLLAYTDLGDGGPRVLADDEVPSDPATVFNPKIMSNAVPVDGAGGEWVRVPPGAILPGSTIKADLPGFSKLLPTVGSGLDFSLGKLYDYLYRFSIDDGALIGRDWRFFYVEDPDDQDDIDPETHDRETLWITPTTGENIGKVVTRHRADLESIIGGDLDEVAGLGDTLWDTLTNLVPSRIDGVGQLLNATLELARYRLRFTWSLQPDPDFDGNPETDPLLTVLKSVRIQRLSKHNGDFSFHGEAIGQGRIRYTLPVGFITTSFRIAPGGDDNFLVSLYREDVTLDRMELTLAIRRDYTPAILTSDPRTHALSFDTSEGIVELDKPEETAIRIAGDPDNTVVSAVVAALPITESSIDIVNVDVDVSTSISSTLKVAAIFAVVFALVAIFPVALLGILPVILALLNPLGAAVIIGLVFVIVVGISAAAALAIKWLVEDGIERGIEQAIREDFPLDELGASLGSVVLYSGEGLAEAIARAVIRESGETLQQPSDHPEDLPKTFARERQRRQFFKTVYVTDDTCWMKIQR